MGRSVSTPAGTVYTSYATLEADAFYCDNCGGTFNRHADSMAKDGDPEFDDSLPADEQESVRRCPHCGEHEDGTHDQREVALQDAFDYGLEDFRRQILEAFPSASACDSWLDREDHAIAENRFAYFGVSEYCGLVAMWVAEKDADYDQSEGWEALRDHWLSQVQQRFRKAADGCFGQALCKQGTFSNGEAFFQPLNGRQQGAMGLGYSSKEGWL